LNLHTYDEAFPLNHLPSSIPIRIYRSSRVHRTDEKVALLVWIHGGGFVLGSNADSYTDELCRRFANSLPIIVVSVNYRLAPEHPFPAALNDCVSVLEWFASEDNLKVFSSWIGGLEIDNKKIIVGGDSAGGNLATVATIKAHEQGITSVIHVVLVYPSYFIAELSNENHYMLTAMMKKFCVKSYLAGQTNRQYLINPTTDPEKLKLLPSAHVITAEFDPLKIDGNTFITEMKKLDKKVYHDHYLSTHGFIYASGIPEFNNAFSRMVEHMETALKQ